ncbi:antibiotic biosynthesis monooxygenase [bacterium]|nr:antibiotic biosynthesis monooxygenase [bacterium]
MIIITAAWLAKAGKENELKNHLINMVKEVRKREPDCALYTLQENPKNLREFLFYEQYKNEAAINLHTNTPHFKALMENTKNLIENDVEVKFYNFIF